MSDLHARIVSLIDGLTEAELQAASADLRRAIARVLATPTKK